MQRILAVVWLLFLTLAGCSDDASHQAGGQTSTGGANEGAGGAAEIGGAGGAASDPCATDNGGCSENAECSASATGVECTCSSGYSGDGITCEDLDECAAGTDTCSDLATCENHPGSFTCACVAGYEGDGFDCYDVDECATGTDDCSPFAACENTDGAFSCSCNPGFDGDGKTCQDVDECAVDHGGCHVLATCTNTEGSFLCACDPGYDGDGFDCQDIDECAVNTGGCDVNATCINTVGSRSCECNTGYSGDGVTCDDIDECLVDNGGCAVEAFCTNLPGGSSCTCSTGYTGDGFVCSDIDECASSISPCDLQAACTNTLGSFSCACIPPYSGDGFTCTCSVTPPVANAVAPGNLAVGAAFQLDGSTSTGTGLSYAWTPLGTAPALTDSNTATPSAVATTCAAFSYELTVTDTCGQTSSDTVIVDPPANGPYVSADTCTPGLQCGSVANPWCNISPAVLNGATSPIMVAAASTPYAGSSMRDGFDVLGGFEPTFSAVRNPDPETNGTTVQTASTAFSWSTGVSATLDGFAIWAAPMATTPATAGVLAVDNGDAVITNVEIDGPNNVFAQDASALRLTGDAWALVDGLTVLRAPRASTRSSGVNVQGTSTLDLIGGVIVQGGVAPESYGIRHVGVSALTLGGGIVVGGAGTTRSAGIWAGGLGFPGTSLSATNVYGGTAPEAYGIHHGIASYLTLADAVVHGVGSAADNSTTCGVWVEETTNTSVSGSEIRGTTGPTSPGPIAPASTVALRLGETSMLDATASITQSDIEGGTNGDERIGIRSVGVPLTLTESTVSGSTSPMNDSGVAQGVELVPAFQVGDVVTIQNNVSITGGIAVGSGGLGAVGVAVRARFVTVHITGNQLIQGALAGGSSHASGILLAPNGSSTGHTIEANALILGGMGSGSDHQGIMTGGTNTTPIEVVVQNNALIAGNLDPVNRPVNAFGMRLRKVDATILNNDRILGGYSSGTGSDGVAGIFAGTGPTEELLLDISGNTIHGGRGWFSRGLHTQGARMSLHHNIIDACGLDGPPDAAPPECLFSLQSWGLFLDTDLGSNTSNNYIFGGYGGLARGCELSTRETGIFEHNLCFAPGKAGGQTRGLWIGSVTAAGPPIIRNNIFDGGANSGIIPADHSAVHFVNSFDAPATVLAHNELVLGPTANPACAGSTSVNSGTCYVDAAAINALNGQNGRVIYGNVDVPMGYVSSNLLHPTVAGYHLDASCVLAGLALPSTIVDDFDGDPRSQLTIGPDECP